MKTKASQSRSLTALFFAVVAAALVILPGNAKAATVGPAGYTNAFGTQPAAADWATLGAAGGSGDNYNPDSTVNSSITASGVTSQLPASSGNPPAASGTAVWSSSGLYLQTRPTGNRYTVLMGKFVNNTGTNATQISIAYGLTIAGTVEVPEETGKGTRVYYSLTGLANSWINLPTLNQTLTSGFTPYSLQLALNWTNGGSLSLMWADDNATGVGIDTANQFDNFSLQVTAGTPPMLACTLTAPTNTAVFSSEVPILAAATLANGTGPYMVEFFTNSGAGNTIFASAGAIGTTPYNFSLGSLPAGTYNIFAVATDSASSPATANSRTNAFFVADPIVLTLTAPMHDATFDNTTAVSAAAMVTGGTAPYAVQFYLDNLPNGAAVTSAPYERNLGALFVGDHAIRATVSDARGWVSNSLAATIHIIGPLGVALTPTNGARFNFGQSVSLDAAAGGGTAPYTVTFYTNDQLIGSIGSPPFTTNLGVLSPGSYTSYVHIVDSSSPIPQEADSTTNIFEVIINPLVVNLISPVNGLYVTAGQTLALAANVTVGAPVAVTNVEFFFDGASVAMDTTPPYSASVANLMLGNHTAYAAATDSLGRKSYSLTNQVTVVSGTPGSNNHFTNAIPLTGLNVTTTGNNSSATREPGEPNTGFGGSHSVWWTWTAPDSGLTTIDTFGSTFDSVLGVYVGNAVNQLTLIGVNDDYFSDNFFSSQSRVDFNAIANTVYRILVDGFGGSSGNITLHITGPNGVSISSPTNGAVFTIGEPIPFTVNISSNFPSPPATRIDIYRSGLLVGSSTNGSLTAMATNTPIGTNFFYAVAYGSTSLSYTSGPVNVFVQDIGVTLLLPQDGTYWNFASSNPIPATAWAYLPAGLGTITNVEFHVDGQKFGEDATPPYLALWTNPVGGSHRLTAIGRSDTGAAYISQPHYIAVYRTFLQPGSIWRYLDDGSNQGTNWIAREFDDSSWASGPSPLGYSDSNGRFPATTNAFGADPNNKHITTYYRNSLVITNVASYLFFYMFIQRDDGVVVYVNGEEVFRNNMPPGTITYTSLASAIASDDGLSTYFAVPNTELFVEGTNVIAAEVHQNVANTPDSWFQLEMYAAPLLLRNASPIVALTGPTNNDYFLAPTNITLTASASDPDGNLAKVEFYSDGVKLGETTNAPYHFDWTNPPTGPHTLSAVATDDEGASQQSTPVHIDVYDEVGTPFVRITSPMDGAGIEGGTNLLVSAYANAPNGVTNVQFFANGSMIGEDTTSPFGVVWDAPFGTNLLNAVAFDSNSFSATSAIVSVRVFPNTTPPTIVTQLPPRGATLTSFGTLVVTFSERVQNVDAGDLLINGIPATGISASSSGPSYLFTFPQPPYGLVEIRWTNGHGITDFGYPTNLSFNELSPEAQWTYTLIDRTPPTIAARTPAAGSTVTNLAQIRVTFSEAVTNVDASDLLVNGTEAFGMTGSGSNYVFDVAQPPMGTVNVTWATNHGILDLAETPNAFNGSNANARWSFALDFRVALVQSNSNWRLFRGYSEASTPTDAWRQPGFNDSTWSNSLAPFFYGDPYDSPFAGIAGTLLSDMQGNYSSIFLRREFTVDNLGAITNLLLNHQSDDGFVAWLNGVEVIRYNVPGGNLPFNGSASSAANEPFNTGAAYIVATLGTNAVSRLVRGTNVMAVHGFNQSLSASSDFGFNAQLYYFPADPSTIPPQLVSSDPAAGDVFYLTNVTIRFSEAVSGVDGADLLVNGTPTTEVATSTNTTYTFSFPQPPYGPVLLTWATNHAIADMDDPPKSFDGASPNATLSYTLINPSNPRILSQIPPANAAITGLTAIIVEFTEPVAGVEALDLLVSGTPASAVATMDNVAYTFSFVQPPYGMVTIRWATNHGITDIETPPNGFDPTRFGGQWNYTFIDPAPSVVITSPTNNAYVLEPANIPFRATATDYDGTVSLVEYFVGADKVGEATNAPYALTVSNVLLGQYTLRAVATDNTGLRGTSAPTVLNVVTSLPVAIVRGPYLNSGSATSGVVRWRTDLPSDAVIWHGPDLDSLTNLVFDATMTTEHIVTLTGLPPDTRWYYSLGTAAQTNAVGSNYWFKTAPLAGTRQPYRFWILGDCGTAGVGSPNRQFSTRDAYYNFAATNGPADIWLMLGDNAYDRGLDGEYQRAVFDIYPDTLRNLFLWPVLGNHETSQSTTADTFPYLDIFSLPVEGEAGGVPSGTEKYYSFDYGNIHFVALDSMTSGRTADSPMADWLRADLEATTAEWIIVYFHHPPYTKGNHDSDREGDLISIRENLVPILETNGVDLVLCGHSHAWERSYLLHGHYGYSDSLMESMKIDGGDGREGGDGSYRKNAAGEGVVYTVAGNAGQVTGGSLDHAAHFVSFNELGTMVLDVNGDRLEALFLRESGEIRDRFSITKPPRTPSVPVHLLAVPTGPNEISLFWTAGSTNHLGLELERSTNGVNFTRIFTLPPEATNALDTALLDNTTYFYRVRATNTFGASDWSAVASASTVMPTSAPRAPVGLAASADDGLHFFRSRMVLTWQDRSTNEAAFQIERSSDGGSFVAIATVAANLDSFVDQGLDSSTLYYYRVRSLNTLGLSTPSNLAGDQTHPQNQFSRAGETVSFHAGPEGAGPVRYQWRFNGVAIPGATNETLALTNVQLGAEGEYAAVVRDASGVLVTRPAYLIVVAPPRIVLEPQNQIGVPGNTLNLSAVAEGTEPMTYHWRKDGAFLPGANSPALTLASIQGTDAGSYDLLVENDFGSTTSRVATVAIYTLPRLEPVSEIHTEVLRPLSVSNFVHDANQPPLPLTFSLGPGAPTNARIHALTGRFSWTPSRAQAPSTNLITVRVDDLTRPVLSNSMTFTVIVNDYVELTAGSAVLLAGTNGFAAIDCFSSAPLLDLQTVLQVPGARLTNLTIEALAPQLATVSLLMPDSNTAAITMTATPGNTLQGAQRLALLHFTAAAGQSSAFLPLHVDSMTLTRANPGPAPTLLANHGRAVIIGTQPLIDARLTNGARELVVYGRVGTIYQMQYATNLANPTWTLRSQFTFTNLSRSFLPGNTPPTNRPAFFRARQP